MKFDLALTVSVMRYISDLHIGKVPTARGAFAFDQESRKYDLAEFLKDRVVGSSDVAGVLAEVEPPYPGYRRTLQALRAYTESRTMMIASNFRRPGERLSPATIIPAFDALRGCSGWLATCRLTPTFPWIRRFTRLPW